MLSKIITIIENIRFITSNENVLVSIENLLKGV